MSYFPDASQVMLWEANLQSKKKRLCLSCAKRPAVMALRTIHAEVLPICKSCSCNWNWYGYRLVKKISLPKLLLKIFWYKIQHPLQRPFYWTIAKDLIAFHKWVRKVKELKEFMKNR